MKGLLLIFSIFIISLSEYSGACSFPGPRTPIEYKGGMVPEFSSEDFAFNGIVVGRTKDSSRVGYTIKVTESWNSRLKIGDIFDIYFFDYDMSKCVLVNPSREINSDALKYGTLVRVISSSNNLPSRSFGWEFYVY